MKKLAIPKRAAKKRSTTKVQPGSALVTLKSSKAMVSVTDTRGVTISRSSVTGRFATAKSARAIDRTVVKYADSLKRLAKR